MWLQGLELLVTVLLARNRPPPPTAAAGVPHAEFAAELVSLPTVLLAMVCEAIVALKVRLAAACARGGRLHGRWERADEVPAYARRLIVVSGAGLASRGRSHVCDSECWQYCE